MDRFDLTLYSFQGYTEITAKSVWNAYYCNSVRSCFILFIYFSGCLEILPQGTVIFTFIPTRNSFF